jgi:hypothetical protein
MFVVPVGVLAQTSQILADPQDVFYVVSPAPNSVVRGNVNSAWRVYDDDQTSIPYDLALLDSAKCATPVARISSGYSNSSKSANNAVSWSSSGPLLNVSHLADGPYCLQLCVALKQGSSSYSACNLRIITVRNNNRAPTITTNPPSVNSISTTGSWQYDVNATDPDGDAIYYTLSGQPGFISINQNTGVISTNGNAKTPGTYNMTVKANDVYGGTASQNFTLTVTGTGSSSSSSSSSSTSSASSSSSSSAPANTESTIEITSPTATTEFKGKTNKISWTASDPDGVKVVTLSYSLDGKNWIKINDVAPSQNEYNWDVEFLKDGSYFLKVDVTDNQNQVTTKISPQFSVNNAALNPGGQNNVGKPLITNVQPGEGAQTDSLRPTISGQFTAPSNAKIDPKSFAITLDDTDIASKCEAKEDSFSCTLTDDLSSGLHKVNAQIKDTNGGQNSKEWTFSVSKPAEQKPPETTLPILGNVSANSVKILLIICILLLLLLLIPWILRRLWKRRQDKEETSESTETIPATDTVAYTTPEITTNYYYPQGTDSTQPTYNYSFSTPAAPTTEPAKVDTYAQSPQPTFEAKETKAEPKAEVASPIMPSSMDSTMPSWLAPQSSSEPVVAEPATTSTTSVEKTEPAAVTTTTTTATPAAQTTTQTTTETTPQASEPLAPAVNPFDLPPVEADGPKVESEPLAPATPNASAPVLPQPSENGSDFGSYGYGKKSDE